MTHRLHEDAQALFTGTLFVALGVSMFAHAGLLTGGTAGVAFLVHYASGWDFGLVYFAANLPFYALAYRRMGKEFTFKTFLSVAMMSAMVHLLPQVLVYQRLHPLFAAVLGGLLVGTGMLVLFRHRASLGGFNVLALILQERFGWRAGAVQMGLDGVIILGAFALVDSWQVMLSVIGAVAMNMTIAINHRPGRYTAI